ncbi:endonuclease/exonuclease/phosphatase family protein [Sorangium sp. So ce375]|uniref:endonuclease/exonuclease/phosphatase family protein n=1 Tax=Sorangium sp. So ce375 TaxID=3133306 RepID=UPI003F5BED14
MLTFTWNLRGKDKALEIACKYLAAKGTVVACFQEMPERTTEDQIRGWSGDALAALTPLTDQRVVMLASRDVVSENRAITFIPGVQRAAAERMVGVDVKAPRLGLIQMVGVHLPDLRNLPRDWPRERIVASLSDQMRLFWNGGPLVVLGDFNAHPFDREIALRTSLWATRDKIDLNDERDPIPARDDFGMDIFHQGERYASRADLAGVKSFQKLRPLYNPMWRWLPERGAHPRGTYYRKDDDSVVTWQCLDQILVSPDLASRIERLEILDRLGDEVLVEANRMTMNGEYGDHLPVELALKNEEVPA